MIIMRKIESICPFGKPTAFSRMDEVFQAYQDVVRVVVQIFGIFVLIFEIY